MQRAGHMLLTVRGRDPRRQISTEGIDAPVTVRLNDFHAKKAGIVAGMGYGWLPEHIAKNELRRGVLVPLRWKSVHVFEPRLFWRAGRAPGRATRLVIDRLKADARRAD